MLNAERRDGKVCKRIFTLYPGQGQSLLMENM